MQFDQLIGARSYRCSAAEWLGHSARAQQPERVRHIGGVLPAAADDPVFQSRLGAFLEGLERPYDASS